jgi:uncharacterized protein YbjT (DUF2867 family)
MFLVTDVTGHIGKAVLAELARPAVSGAGPVPSVRAVIDSSTALPLQAPNIEAAHCDVDDPASLEQVMKGVEAVFLACPFSPQIAEEHARIVAAARAAGVARLVQLSGVGADAGLCCARALRWLGQAENSVAASGLPVTRLRPTFLFQMLLEFSRSIARQGLIAGPFRSTQWTWVDARDVAAVAVAALRDPRHENCTYVITGAESLNFPQIAQRLGTILEKPLRYADITANEARGWLQGKGMPPVMIEAKLELWDACASNWLNVAPNSVVKDVTGREPRTLEDFARDYKSLLLSAPAV